MPCMALCRTHILDAAVLMIKMPCSPSASRRVAGTVLNPAEKPLLLRLKLVVSEDSICFEIGQLFELIGQ
jgi:hypothetical protein